jgi:MSHA biogenesis protein MshP
MTRTRQKQRGFAMVAAIFLMVILAALGAFMLTFSSTQHVTSAQDIQGSRAYWAARAGLEWAISSVKATSACAGPPASLEGFTLAISCPSQGYDEGGAPKTFFTITSLAKSGTSVGSPGYIERSVSVTVVLKAPGVWDVE